MGTLKRRAGAVEVLAPEPAAGRLRARSRRLLRRLLLRTGRPGWGVTVILTGDREIRRLNRRWRRHDRTTDVLSFPSGGDLEPGRPHLGEIAVSVARAARQARRAGWALEDETALLLTHGFLHLLGYDHRRDGGTMRRLEARLLRQVAGVRLERRRLPWGGAPGAAGRRRSRGRTR